MERNSDILSAEAQNHSEQLAYRLLNGFGERADSSFARPPRELQTDLAQAIAACELQVHFQGRFDLDTGKGVGVEALARWLRPDGRQVPPAVFIPIAERTGLICGLGAGVLQRACESVAAWPDVTQTPPTLSVNVSSLQINEGIESERQLYMLQQLRCRLGQGYLFAAPEPPAQAWAHLANSWGRRMPIFRRDQDMRAFHAS